MNDRRLPLVYICLALVSLVLGLIVGLVHQPIWFARMGALVVLFGAMSEFALLKLELSQLYSQLESGKINKTLPPSRWHQHKALVSHVIVVLGTLIWGFGDLFL